MIAKINIDKLLKAQSVFERFRIDMQDERDEAGAVQAFEFCYELCLKIMKKVLAIQGLETGSPKDTFRKAALEKLIEDPETWFGFLEARNLTLHTYEQENVKKILTYFDSFSSEMKKLISAIKALE